MEIKRIQLRGISRSPSDRMTDDGGVAESLNTQIIDGEIAPITEPVSCLEDFGVRGEYDHNEVVFIHKTSSYEHAIVYNHIGDQLSYVTNGETKPIIEVQDLKNVVSLGNTLIISHAKGVSYALFKDGQYYEIALDEDSLPKLSFVNVDVEAGYRNSASHKVWMMDEFYGKYGVYIEGNPEKDYLVTKEEHIELANQIWESYRSMIDNNLKQGCLSQPVMIRYGLRLYDNSYLWASSPIMLGSCLPKTIMTNHPVGNFDDFHSSVISYSLSSSVHQQHKAYVKLASPYRIGINLHRTNKIAALKDIVTSIDVFVSKPIDFYPNGKDHIKKEAVGAITDEWWDYCTRYILDPANSENPKKVEEAVLAASNFFLLKRYDIDDLPEEMDIFDGDLLGETLFTQSQLKDNDVVTTIAGANFFSTYNQHLVAGGIDEYFSRGIGVLNGQCANPHEPLLEAAQKFTYGFAYHVPSANAIVKDFDAKTGFVPMTPDVGKGAEKDDTIVEMASTPYAWISHPNPNCNKVTVRLYTDGAPYYTYDIEMKRHPYLSCSYAFLGIGQNLYREGAWVGEDDFDSFNDRPITKRHNVTAMSNLENPFVFGLASKVTLNDDIKGFAIATEPMSTGQFGQYPIYFFLEDGVWTTTIAADGNFGSAPNLASREVCSNPNTITPSKNAVYFMTDRGLLLISGQTTVCISEHMHGKPYAIPEQYVSLIECAGFEGLITDEPVERFRDFMNNPDTKIAYDYVGERLICFNPYLEHQYIYAIKTQTWHRAHYGTLNRVINAYPRCAVTTKTNERSGSMIVTKYGLVDLSLSYDETLATKKIAIATRPFDLANPDVYKTIKDIRVRGQYPRGAVKFILQASNDGINFCTINTLRGKSWKMFRMIILADLDPTDRISWVDVMFETRFTNKLR